MCDILTGGKAGAAMVWPRSTVTVRFLRPAEVPVMTPRVAPPT